MVCSKHGMHRCTWCHAATPPKRVGGRRYATTAANPPLTAGHTPPRRPAGRTLSAAKAVGTATQVGVFAGNVAATPRWRGTHWAAGLGGPVRSATWAHVQQAPLPTATVRKRGMYGY